MNILCLTFVVLSFGITQDDVFRGINDTTNSALRTGITIAGGRVPKVKGTTCYMHAQELVVQHALGLRQRSVNKKIVDEFAVGKALKDKVKILVSKIMDKRNKQRFIWYSDYVKKYLKMDVRKLELPNDTRVSGVFLMYESVLRSKKAISMYCSGGNESLEYLPLALTDPEWDLLAETYTVLKYMNVVAMTSQQQSIDSNCLSYYSVCYARFFMESSNSFDIMNLSQHWTPATDPNSIPVVTLQLQQLPPETRELKQRLIKEFDHYFAGPDSDHLSMMIFHPVMVWQGIK